MNLGSVRDQTQDDAFRFRGVRGPEHLIPFASRAAAVRSTWASSAWVPNRRLNDPSRSGWGSRIISASLQTGYR